MHVERLLGVEAGEVLSSVPFAVLPMGSVEYHGPLAPLGTDLLLCQWFADACARELDCVVYPPIAYTACPHKTSRAPTLSVPPSVMVSYVLSVMQGIQRSGIQRLLVLNAHDGNMGIARVCAEQMGDSFQTLIVNWWQLLGEADTEGFFTGGGRGHGGPFELSAARYVMGDADFVAGTDRDIPAHKFPPPHVLVEAAPKGFDGYAGLVSEASFEKGECIIKTAWARLREVIDKWLLQEK